MIRLDGCRATPFGSYLKALGVLRLLSEQADGEARGWWNGETFVIESALSQDELVEFFLHRYAPTPIVAPWNGGSGFYPKDNKAGIDAIAGTSAERFASYRTVIQACREMEAVQRGPVDKDLKGEEERRTAILLQCRNELPDTVVEWLDAAVGISAEGIRAFSPVLGTGGNEGRLDYTNNFMSRVAALLIQPESVAQVRELLLNSLSGHRTEKLKSAAAGQYDPGRAGGANQGQGISSEAATNPWDFVLAMEGAVAWASGLYRRQGVSYRSFLCSPFTVRAVSVGFGSASREDDARAEIWAPLWERKARYEEIRVLLREGRASAGGRVAETGLEFAEAATGLGVDRSIVRFVRYSLLKRRGDSYVALPAGSFPAEHRSESDQIRQLQSLVAAFERDQLPPGCESLRRQIDAAMFDMLLRGGRDRLRATLAATGRLARRIVTTTDAELPFTRLEGPQWLRTCGMDTAEVRIAAALGSLYDREAGYLRGNLTRKSGEFAWQGRDFAARLLAVLERRLRKYTWGEGSRPFDSRVRLDGGDVTPFIEGITDDDLIEDLMFAFACMRWPDRIRCEPPLAKPLPVYAAIKHLFLPTRVVVNGEETWLKADSRIPALLRSDDVSRAARLAIDKLRFAGLKPVRGDYPGGIDGVRLGAALLIPAAKGLKRAILHRETREVTTGA